MNLPQSRIKVRLAGYVAGGLLALTAAGRFATGAWGDDHADVEALLHEAARDGAHAAVTRDLVTRARAALDRAAQLRAAGDEPHARLADGLARELAQSARDLSLAVDAETKARTARFVALDAGARAERERALLEEGIARAGRLRAELAETDRSRKEAPPKTNTAAAMADGGASVPPASSSLGDGGLQLTLPGASGGGPGPARTGSAGVERDRGAP